MQVYALKGMSEDEIRAIFMHLLDHKNDESQYPLQITYKQNSTVISDEVQLRYFFDGFTMSRLSSLDWLIDQPWNGEKASN